jgi:hypothetical protein
MKTKKHENLIFMANTWQKHFNTSVEQVKQLACAAAAPYNTDAAQAV